MTKKNMNPSNTEKSISLDAGISIDWYKVVSAASGGYALYHLHDLVAGIGNPKWTAIAGGLCILSGLTSVSDSHARTQRVIKEAAAQITGRKIADRPESQISTKLKLDFE